jgi:DNA-binding MarR family transcriptional regulator
MSARRRDTVLEALERLRKVEPHVTFMHALTFLYVAENEGLNVSELAMICRTSRATASRNARGLGDRSAMGALAPYAGLIEQRRNPASAHGRLLFLTAAGRRLRDDIDALIGESRRIAPAENAAA